MNDNEFDDQPNESLSTNDFEGLSEPVRKPKRALLFNTPETWLPLGMSERLLRQRPGEPVLYQCTNHTDPAATARNIISFCQRIKSFIPDFSIRTTQCIVVSTTFKEVDGQKSRAPEDTCERYIKVVVESNSLYTKWLERESRLDAEAELAMKLAEAEGPRPRGRPKTLKSEAAEVPKRGRGRPRKTPDAQDKLL